MPDSCACDLERVLLVEVAQLREVLVAVEGVVVEVELGVGGEHAAVLRDDQRVDLGQRAVALVEGAVEAGDQRAGRAHQVAAEADLDRQLAALERLEADGRVDGRAVDRLRVARGDLLDLDAALGARPSRSAGRWSCR